MSQVLVPDHLDGLAQLLVASPPPGPRAVGLTATPTAIELSLRPLPEADPLRGLIGFRAPTHWYGVGVVASAMAHRSGSSAAVTVAHLVSRTGSTVTRVGQAPPVGRPSTGPLADLCRRTIGLATPPAEAGTATLLALVWLDRVLVELCDHDLGDDPPSWSRCQELLNGAPATGRSTEELGRLGSRFARRWPWALVRRHTVEHPRFGLTGSEAAWFDDGSFSRWVLGCYPDLHDIRTDVVQLLRPSTAAQLDEVLGAWIGPARARGAEG